MVEDRVFCRYENRLISRADVMSHPNYGLVHSRNLEPDYPRHTLNGLELTAKQWEPPAAMRVDKS